MTTMRSGGDAALVADPHTSRDQAVSSLSTYERDTSVQSAALPHGDKPSGSLSGDRGWLSSGWIVAALLALHVITWTVYGTVALGVSIIHDDMIEAWNWGQSPQLGYYKHPPLFAWVTWAWFQLFPVADWSFYLMSAVNSAVGLLGVAALARFFGLKEHRQTVLALLMLTPLYGFLALKYNANAVLIPFWPWAAWALLRSLETRRALHGALLGLLTGLAMLGKYYSVLLALAFIGVSLLPIYRRSYYRSPAPYVAILTALVVVAPHVWWSVANGYPTVAYALSKFHYPFSQILFWGVCTAAAPVIFLSLPFGLAVLGARQAPGDALRCIWRWLMARSNGALAIVAAVPFLLTIGFGLIGHAKVSLSYTIPIFFTASLVIVAALPAGRSAGVDRIAVRSAIVFMVGVMLLSPLIGYWRLHGRNELVAAPIPELARVASQQWREATGQPLKIIATNDRFIGAVSFYGPDRPLFYVNLNQKQAAWISQADVDTYGYLAVCRTRFGPCEQVVRQHAPPGSPTREVTLARTVFGKTLASSTYTLTFVLPKAKPGPVKR